MQLFALGLNHHTAPLAVREQVAFQPDHLGAALNALVRERSLREALILSTCNRTELYCAANDERGNDAVDSVASWLAQYHALPRERLQPYLYSLPQQDTVRHLFRVASGLDSMVLGEPQILGQMKQAARTAEEAGTLGTHLGKLLQNSFAVAKEVRSTTAIGANIVSMAAAAVHLAGRIFENISEQNVLFIGAGEMIELCVAHFAGCQPKRIAIANRSTERAAQLVQRFNATAMRLDEMPQRLAEFDIVVSCTASPLPVIGLGMAERALKTRRHRPMVMVDLAVPRDIEQEIDALDDIFLYTMDDLGNIVSQGIESRQAAVVEAEGIIDTQVDHFLHWLDARESVPTIRALRDAAERMRRHELEQAQKRLARGEEPTQVLALLSQALTNKLLHAPTQALAQAAGAERRELARQLRQVYRLHPED